LRKICDINPRLEKNLGLDLVCYFIPMDYVDEISGTIRDRSVKPVSEVAKGYTAFIEGDVLFAKITPCMENGKCTIAKNLINGRRFGSTEFHVIRPTESITSNWIFYFLRQTKIRQDAERNMTGSAGQKRVPTQYLSELKIPLPSFEEQERIAQILAKCDRIRRTRRYTQQLSDTYLQSVFLEMFGDPATNPKKWEIITIGELAKVATGGTPDRTKLEFYAGSIPWVKTGEVLGNVIYSTEECLSEAGLADSNCRLLPVNTIIIAMYGQGLTRGRCAKLGIKATTNQACAAILPNSKFDSDYLLLLLKISYEKIRELGRGGNQPNLNLDLVRKFQVILPPIPLQEKFAEVVQKYDRLRAQQREATRQAEHLFQTTLHRAFSGEL
jgi:type I restriction enzyme, S subunit